MDKKYTNDTVRFEILYSAKGGRWSIIHIKWRATSDEHHDAKRNDLSDKCDVVIYSTSSFHGLLAYAPGYQKFSSEETFVLLDLPAKRVTLLLLS
jgi:hypothetical protein